MKTTLAAHPHGTAHPLQAVSSPHHCLVPPPLCPAAPCMQRTTSLPLSRSPTTASLHQLRTKMSVTAALTKPSLVLFSCQFLPTKTSRTFKSQQMLLLPHQHLAVPVSPLALLPLLLSRLPVCLSLPKSLRLDLRIRRTPCPFCILNPTPHLSLRSLLNPVSWPGLLSLRVEKTHIEVLSSFNYFNILKTQQSDAIYHQFSVNSSLLLLILSLLFPQHHTAIHYYYYEYIGHIIQAYSRLIVFLLLLVTFTCKYISTDFHNLNY